MTMVSGLAVIINLWRFNPISNLMIHPGAQAPPLECFIDVDLKLQCVVARCFAAVRDFENILNM